MPNRAGPGTRPARSRRQRRKAAAGNMSEHACTPRCFVKDQKRVRIAKKGGAHS